jgi:hypothetical protein
LAVANESARFGVELNALGASLEQAARFPLSEAIRSASFAR